MHAFKTEIIGMGLAVFPDQVQAHGKGQQVVDEFHIAFIAHIEGIVVLAGHARIVAFIIDDNAGVEVFAHAAHRHVILVYNLFALHYILPLFAIVVLLPFGNLRIVCIG